MPMDLLEVARLRLRNQRVMGQHLQTPGAVVAWLGCVQSQEYSLAKWSLGMRMPGTARESDVDGALTRGEVLRTHILRPTWHYVAPADIRWIMRLTGPKVLSGTGSRQRNLGLDSAQLAMANDVMCKSLEGGKHLTRPELQAELERAGLDPTGQRIVHMLTFAEMSLLIASGAPRGDVPTYALLDEWAPPTVADQQPFDREPAVAELTRRFFTSHGPATLGDFTWWSGIGQAETKRGLSINGAQLEEISVAGERMWWAGDHGGSADFAPSPTVHLMQAYDEYVVAYRSPRTPINVAGLGSPSVLQQTPFYHAIFVDTQLAGFWRRLKVKDGYSVETSLLRALNASERSELEAQVARYSEFVERPVTLV